MLGKILFYDESKATGIISGDDGRRYNFLRTSFGNNPTTIRLGQEVDFEISDNQAANIYPVAQGSGQIGTKSKVAAGLLGILLGSLGIHKFYIGATGAGVVMLVITIFGMILIGLPAAIMAIIGIVEGIIYLTKSDEDFYRIYEVGKKPWF